MLPVLILPLALSQPAAGPNPATLSGQTYYLASELDEIQHHFDPDHWVDGEPMQISFEAPGKVTLQYSQEDDYCTFSAAGKRSAYVLVLTCPGLCGPGSSNNAKPCATNLTWKARWVWLGPHRARTSLLSAGSSPEVIREVVETHPIDLEVREALFDREYAAAELPKLVGAYQDDKGLKLAIAPDGTATLAGQAIKVTLKRCSAEAPLPTTAPCLLRQPSEGEAQVGSTVYLAVERAGHLVLEEGLFGSDVAYFPFEAVPRARHFGRVVEEKTAPMGR